MSQFLAAPCRGSTANAKIGRVHAVRSSMPIAVALSGASRRSALGSARSGAGPSASGSTGGGSAWPLASGGVVIVAVPAGSLAPVLTAALRDSAPAFAAAVLLDRPVSTLRLCAEHALRRAARAPGAVIVDAAPHDPRTVPLTAAMRLAVITMRRRSPAAWRAIDALDAHRGNAAAAARSLGCSPQSVREHRARADYAATLYLSELLAALTIPHQP